jgi:hypothetical protein
MKRKPPTDGTDQVQEADSGAPSSSVSQILGGNQQTFPSLTSSHSIENLPGFL